MLHKEICAAPGGGWWIADVRFTNLLEDCPDDDGDGVPNPIDNCPLTFNPDQLDQDTDMIGDVCDNRTLVENSDQCDTNNDGFGNVCDADLDNNLIVNSFDLTIMRDNFGAMGVNDSDLTCDGVVNSFDLTIMRDSFGLAPGPSAFAP